MIKFIAKRLGISLVVLVLGSALLYILTINSGDPLEGLRESNAPNRENLIRQRTINMRLDLPWYQRYFTWLGGASKCLVGACDLGKNAAGQDVTSLVVSAAGSTLRLVIMATVLAIVIGVTLGVLTAVRQYSGFDYATTLMAFVFFSLPVFWAAVLLKHYAAIQFNDWLGDPRLSALTIATSAIVLAFVVQAALGGTVKRRLITFGALAVVIAGVMFYFDAVSWFRVPAVGLPIYILGVVGIGILVLYLGAGFSNKKVRNAVAVTAVVAIVSYSAMRGVLLTSPSTLLLLGCLLSGVAVAVAAGFLLGGFSRKKAVTESVVLILGASLIAIVDLLLSNWNAYIRMQPRPIPTIGSQTPNFSADYWGHAIDSLTALLLPTIVLTLVSIASYTRYTRASMLDVLNQDYIRTARSKGISERNVIMRHALRNSMIPLATIVAFDFAGLIGGAVITETVFGWQGMGNLFRTGLLAVDPNPVMGFYVVTGTAAVIMNMVADIAYAFLDPRISR